MSQSLHVTSSTTLEGEFDPRAEAAAIPLTYVVKGMFFASVVQDLGSAWSKLQTELVRPPRLGRYIPFQDYPQADYTRLACAAAKALYPRAPLTEGLRRIARRDFDVFAKSTLGRVVLAAVGDARTALLQTPAVYSKVARGDWKISVRELDDRTCRLDFVPHPTNPAYQIGQLEGIVLAFASEPEIIVYELEGKHVRFDVMHR